MIQKIAAVIVVALLFTGCNDIYYDAETRLILEGKLVDKDGNPLPGQRIEIEVREDDGVNYSDHDLISEGFSDANGAFRFFVPAPTDTDHSSFNLKINESYEYPVNGRYQDKKYTNIRRHNFTDYRFNINAVKLFRNEEIATLGIATEQTNFAHELTFIDIVGDRADREINFNSNTIDFEFDHYSVAVKKNQTLTLKYTVIDNTNQNNPITNEYSVLIEIGDSPNPTYTLSY